MDPKLRPSYISTGYVLGQISPKYVVSQILVQNGDFLYKEFARMTEYTKILYEALGPLSAFGEPLAVYARFVTNWPNSDQLADQLAQIRPTGQISRPTGRV